MDRTDEVQGFLNELRASLKESPNDPHVLNDLAWVLATTPVDSLRNGREAVKLAEKAVKLTKGKEAGALDTLGVAYAEAGSYRRAVEYTRQALDMAREKKLETMIGPLTMRLKRFSQQQPFRDE